MPILMPSDTATLLGADARRCESRSLFLDRFANPGAKDDSHQTPRKDWFNRLIGLSPVSVSRAVGNHDLPRAVSFHAQLQSRLMVNMAGGVMENAGLCLDRFGLPYIPGSAVKGCARRMATQMLLEADGADAKTRLLTDLALVFGWGDSDWKTGRHKGAPISDFWWAMAEDEDDCSADSIRDSLWTAVAGKCALRLLEQLGLRNPLHAEEPWLDLPNFAGLISFLPARPVDATGIDLPLHTPSMGKLELDVLTCHHPDYYSGEKQKSVALDDENPNPVLFPAVAAGHVFCFVIAPLRNCGAEVLATAKTWLRDGLEVFGLGAKTAAGYGWFNSDETLIEEPIRVAVNKRKQAAEESERKRREREQAAREEAERIRKNREAEARRSELSADEREDLDLDEMARGSLLQHIEKLEKLPAEKQSAVYRLLQSRDLNLWRELRAKAEQGNKKEKKRFGPVVQALYKMAKDRKEKMPK